MSIKKFKPSSPDKALGKIKGDIELARLGHLNQLVDQIRKVITLPVPANNDVINITTSAFDTVIKFEGNLPNDFTLNVIAGPQAVPGDKLYLFLTTGSSTGTVTFGEQIVYTGCGSNNPSYDPDPNSKICLILVFDGESFIGIDTC